MLNSQCSIPIRTEGGRTSPTSTSAENCALGIEHWSDRGSVAEQWILPSHFFARALSFRLLQRQLDPARPLAQSFLEVLQLSDVQQILWPAGSFLHGNQASIE